MTDQDRDDESADLGEPEDAHDGPVCPSCFFAVEEDFDYCPNCEAPLSQFSTVDPLKTIRSEGEMFRRGVKSPSILIVIGMWLIFLPGIIVAFMMLAEAGNARIPVTVAVGLMFWFYGSVLYKVTSRYLEVRKAARTDNLKDGVKGHS